MSRAYLPPSQECESPSSRTSDGSAPAQGDGCAGAHKADESHRPQPGDEKKAQPKDAKRSLVSTRIRTEPSGGSAATAVDARACDIQNKNNTSVQRNTGRNAPRS